MTIEYKMIDAGARRLNKVLIFVLLFFVFSFGALTGAAAVNEFNIESIRYDQCMEEKRMLVLSLEIMAEQQDRVMSLYTTIGHRFKSTLVGDEPLCGEGLHE